MISQRYWDSDQFLGWLNREPDRFAVLDAIIDDAAHGKLRIVTSTITYAEVYWIKGYAPQPHQIEAIKKLFEFSWIVPIELDQKVAELARELLFVFAQNDGLRPKDAIHLASAIRSRAIGDVETFDTYDGVLGRIGPQLHRVSLLRAADSGADIQVGPPSGIQTLIRSSEIAAAILSELPSVQSAAVAQATTIAPVRPLPAAPQGDQEPPPQGFSVHVAEPPPPKK